GLEEVKVLLEKGGGCNEDEEEIMDMILKMWYGKNLDDAKGVSDLGEMVEDGDRMDGLGGIGIGGGF
ncbi:hypothetical protein, partial [Staphylococcus auricularis]|uniref:hypothetical protein n=1 Tax=Staphylococcus auricularis TaxID=29379 RepID=UPI0038508ECF